MTIIQTLRDAICSSHLATELHTHHRKAFTCDDVRIARRILDGEPFSA